MNFGEFVGYILIGGLIVFLIRSRPSKRSDLFKN